MDAREGGDIHMLSTSFQPGSALATANGHTENHVMQIGGRWGFTEQARISARCFGIWMPG